MKNLPVLTKHQRVTVKEATGSGMDSVTSRWQFTQQLANKDRDTIIFHVGDYDLTGLNIFDSLTKDVQAFAADDCDWLDIEFRRLALTEELIIDLGLELQPRNPRDTKPYKGIAGNTRVVCNAEAIPPKIFRTVVKNAILGEIDQQKLGTDLGSGPIKQ